MALIMKTYKLNQEYTTKVEEPMAAYFSSGGSYTTIQPSIIQTIRNGVSMASMSLLTSKMLLSLVDLSNILHVSLRTLQRYKADHILDSDTTAKVVQLKMLNEHGIEVFGDQLIWNNWLREPIQMLGGSTPLEYMDTPFGFQLLHQILGRIEYGVHA